MRTTALSAFVFRLVGPLLRAWLRIKLYLFGGLWRLEFACPTCAYEFEMGKAPWFTAEDMGLWFGTASNPTTHWAIGTQTCPRCLATWGYGVSE